MYFSNRRKHRGSRVEVAPQLDLACQDSVARFAEAVASRPGPLDILVNNAGVGNGYRHTCAAQQRCFTKQGVGMLTQVMAGRGEVLCSCWHSRVQGAVHTTLIPVNSIFMQKPKATYRPVRA
jgi:NAD(P)-dependent dehydrogenase (short-subunit alcohol dehydrogenase family)